jgi:hypothetical protein
MLTQQRLKELFDYNNGQLIRKFKGLRTKVGDVVGWNNGNGYIRLDVDGKKYYAHRLIWIYHNGQCEDALIDHIDGNRSNNCIENLRLSDVSKNGLNRTKSRSDSTTGLIGVLCTTKKNGTKVYQSKLTVNKKVVFCLNFKTAEKAHLAYLEAKKNLVIF